MSAISGGYRIFDDLRGRLIRSSTGDEKSKNLLRRGLTSLGFSSIGATVVEMEAATAESQWVKAGRFANREPASAARQAYFETAKAMAKGNPKARPAQQIPVVTPVFKSRAEAAPVKLAATWFGHASVLLELAGIKIFFDPVLSNRVSPFAFGPSRMHRAPLTVSQLPDLDVVVLSHDHYDHLDFETISGLLSLQPNLKYIVPLGVDAHLRAWGVAHENIFTADWFGSVTLFELNFQCFPARHFSGRGLVRDTTLWASWAVTSAEHSVYFSGDSGFSENFAEVAALAGPFDLSIIAIGAYDELWPDIHLNPEEAIRVHQLINGAGARRSKFLPIHWATFNLALHDWAEPIQRLAIAAAAAEISLLTPQPGERYEYSSGEFISDVAVDGPLPPWWLSIE